MSNPKSGRHKERPQTKNPSSSPPHPPPPPLAYSNLPLLLPMNQKMVQVKHLIINSQKPPQRLSLLFKFSSWMQSVLIQKILLIWTSTWQRLKMSFTPSIPVPFQNWDVIGWNSGDCKQVFTILQSVDVHSYQRFGNDIICLIIFYDQMEEARRRRRRRRKQSKKKILLCLQRGTFTLISSDVDSIVAPTSVIFLSKL